MIIRNAEKKDLLKCQDLGKMDELIWASGGYYDVEFLEKYISKNGTFLVLEDDEKIVGFILGEKLMAGGSIIWSLGIDYNYRGKGYGTLLLKNFEQNIKNIGGEWVYLVGRSGNVSLKNFYIKNGFSAGKENIEFEKFFKL